MNKLTKTALLCVGLLLSATIMADDNVKQINPEFFSEEQTADYLADSEYIENWGTFDVQSRLRKKEYTIDDVRNFVKRQACPWSEDAIKAVQNEIDFLNKKIVSNGYKLPLPEKVPFMLTTMIEEGDCVAYTRKDGIAIRSRSVLSSATATLVAHELFHVLTRNNPDFKAEIYKLIGFEILEKDITVPDSFKNMMISNPDVECHNSCATFTIDGKAVDCAMFIYSDREWTGRTFFDYLNIGLLEIDKKNCTLILKDGKPVIHKVSDAEDFYEKVGFGTDYIIDPEEILADNFADVLCGYTDSKLTQAIHQLLQK